MKDIFLILICFTFSLFSLLFPIFLAHSARKKSKKGVILTVDVGLLNLIHASWIFWLNVCLLTIILSPYMIFFVYRMHSVKIIVATIHLVFLFSIIIGYGVRGKGGQIRKLIRGFYMECKHEEKQILWISCSSLIPLLFVIFLDILSVTSEVVYGITQFYIYLISTILLLIATFILTSPFYSCWWR